MSQHDLIIDNAAGATVRADLNVGLQALGTKQAGTSAPSVTYANEDWADTTNAILKRRDTGNTAWRITDSLDTARVLAKTGTYTVAINDFSKTIDATSGTWTLNLLAVATAGDGFWFMLRNSGSGVVTIDPNSSEQVDGAATKTIPSGFSCLVVCNGSLWRTVGMEPDMVGDSGSGGTRGLVPAPASGDAAANKFLKASGAWAAITTPPITKEFVSTDQTITSGGSLTLAHGLGAVPKIVRLQLVCQTAENNYSIGDILEMHLGHTYSGSGAPGVSVVSDATNLNVRFGSLATNCFVALDKTTGALQFMTNTKWKARFSAWA